MPTNADEIERLLADADAASGQSLGPPEGAAPITASDVDSLLGQAKEERHNFLRAALGEANSSDLDRSAQVKSLADRIGLDESFVARNFDDAQRAWTESQFDPERWERENPHLAAMVQARQLPPTATGDEPLGLFRKAIRKLAAAEGILDEIGRERPWWLNLASGSLGMVSNIGLAGSQRAHAPDPETGISPWDAAGLPRKVTTLDDERAREGQAKTGLSRVVDVPLMVLGDQLRDREVNSLATAWAWAKLKGGDGFAEGLKLAEAEAQALPRDYGSPGLVEDVLVSAAQILPSQAETGLGALIGGGGAFLLTGSPAAATVGAKLLGGAAGWNQEFAGAIRDYRKAHLDDGRPLDDGIVIAGAAAYASVSAWIETWSFGADAALLGPGAAQFKALGKAGFLRELTTNAAFRAIVSRAAKVLESGATEGIEEATQRIAQDVIGYLGRVGQARALQSSDVAGSLEEAGATFGTTALGSLAIAGGGAALGSVARDLAGGPSTPTAPGAPPAGPSASPPDAGQAAPAPAAAPPAPGLIARVAGKLSALGRRQQLSARSAATAAAVLQAAGSPTAIGHPDAFAELVSRELRESGEETAHLWLDPDGALLLWQGAGLDPNEAAVQLLGPDGPRRIDEARQLGARVAIPVAALPRIRELPAAQGLDAHVTTRPDADTRAKAEAEGKALEAEVQALLPLFEQDAAPPVSEGEARLLANLGPQIAASGLYPKGGEKHPVALARAFVRAVAARAGVPEAELFDYGLSINSAGKPAAANTAANTAAPNVVTPAPEAAPPVPAAPAAPATPAAPTMEAAQGAATRVITPQRREGEPAHYALIEAESLVPSHDPHGFTPRADYPAGVQEREYHRQPEEQAKVVQGAQKLDPALLLSDSPTAVDGPPMVTSGARALVMGGNGRSMMLLRGLADPDTAARYRSALEAKAQAFGLSPAQIAGMRNPVLVRVLDEVGADAPATDLAAAVRRTNEGLTQALSPRARAVAEAKMLSPEAVRDLGELLADDETTLREAMRERPAAFLAILRREGIVSNENASAWHSGGILTDEAKERIEGMFLGRVVGSGDRMAATAPGVLAKLERIVPLLLRVEGINPAASEVGLVQGALDLLNEARARGMPLAVLVGQGSLFGGDGRDPDAVRLAQLLDESKPTQLAVRFKAWAAQAATDPRQATMFSPAPTPEALRKALLAEVVVYRQEARPLDQTETPAFRAWFGDSKVIDEDGHPLVVFHGTTAKSNFDKFKQMKKGREIGFHFGTTEAAGDRLIQTRSTSKKKSVGDVAEGARILPVYLSIQNPVVLDADPGNFQVYRLLTSEERIPESERQGRGPTLRFIDGPLLRAGVITHAEKEELSQLTLGLDQYDETARARLIEILEAKGFDGFSYPNEFEGKGSTSWVAFRPEQIKSAIGNRGTFDPASPIILYQPAWRPNEAALAKAEAPFLLDGEIPELAEGSPAERFSRALERANPALAPEHVLADEFSAAYKESIRAKVASIDRGEALKRLRKQKREGDKSPALAEQIAAAKTAAERSKQEAEAAQAYLDWINGARGRLTRSAEREVHPLDRALADHEWRHRRKENEHAAAFDPETGEKILGKTSNHPSYVGFEDEEIDRLRAHGAAVFTHNHPGGNTLSVDDLVFAKFADLAEMRASLPNGGVWRLRRPEGGWKDPAPIKESAERVTPRVIAWVEATRNWIRSAYDLGARMARTRMDAKVREAGGNPADGERAKGFDHETFRRFWGEETAAAANDAAASRGEGWRIERLEPGDGNLHAGRPAAGVSTGGREEAVPLGTQLRLFQAAYHGTPHRHDGRFLLEKIGLGEGARAYGWGLYFAEEKAVAESYRAELSGQLQIFGRGPENDAERMVLARIGNQGLSFGQQVDEEHLAKATEEVDYFLKARRKRLRELKAHLGGPDPYVDGNVTEEHIAEEAARVKGAEAEAKLLRKLTPADLSRSPGQLFQVEVPDAHELLDWDAPITGQPPGVLAALERAGVVEREADGSLTFGDLHGLHPASAVTGDDLYAALKAMWEEGSGPEGLLSVEAERGDKAVSLFLNSLGIPGLRYLDGGSRSDGEGTRNFVIWDESRISTTGTFYQANREPLILAAAHHLRAMEIAQAAGMEALAERHLERYRGYAERLGFNPDERTAPEILAAKERLPPPSLREELLGPGEAFRFFQAQANAPRGWMKRQGRNFEITLTPNADRSTLPHELGHVFLEILRDVAGRADTAEAVKGDFARLMEWTGFGSGAGMEQNLAEAAALAASFAGREPTVEEAARLAALAEPHERFARGIEALLWEGKAPSTELGPAFARFRGWLRKVYPNLAALDVPMEPGVKDLFARLFAVDEEIGKLAEASSLSPAESLSFVLEEAGLSPEEIHAYGEARAKTLSTAARRAELKVLKEALRQQDATWKDEEASLRTEAEAEWDSLPERRAWLFLRGRLIVDDGLPGTAIPLDRALVRAAVGDEAAKRFTTRRSGGTSPDSLAELFGFSDGAAMLRAIVALPERKAWAKERAAERMAERHPGLLEDRARLRAEISKGIHGDHTAEWALQEHRALNRLAKPGEPDRPLSRKAIRLAAQQAAEWRSVGELAREASLAERRAAGFSRQAYSLSLRKDYGQAAARKVQQILNESLGRELRRLEEETGKAFDYLKARTRDAYRAELGKASPDLLLLHDAILSGAGISPREIDGAEVDAALSRIEGAAAADGNPLAFDLPLLRIFLRAPRPWRELTPGTALVLRDAAKQFRRIAVSFNEITLAGERAKIEDLVERIGEEAESLPDLGKAAPDRAAVSFARKKLDQALWIHGGLVGPEATLKALGATAHRIFERFLECKTHKLGLQERFLAPLADLWGRMPAELQRGIAEPIPALNELLPFPADVNLANERPRTLGWLLMVALNMGNESNKERLLGGFGWTEDQVIRALDEHLPAAAIEWINAVWAVGEGELWTMIAAKEARKTGLAPPKIEASELVLKGGTLRGGYFPAKYDPRASAGDAGERQEAATIANLLSPPYVKPATAKSHTKQRAAHYANVINLEWSIYPAHLNQVLHDLAFDEFTRETARLLTHPKMKEILHRRFGERRAKEPIHWLKYVATAGAPEIAADGLNQIAGVVKSRLVGRIIKWALTTPLGDFANAAVAGAMGEAKFRWLAATYPLALPFSPSYRWARRYALERSAELQRQQRFPKVAKKAAFLKRITEGRGRLAHLWEIAGHAGWAFMELTQKMATTQVWLARFWEERWRGLEEGEAARHADEAVRASQMTNDRDELPRFLRDPGALGSILLFSGYFLKLYEIGHARIGGRLVKNITAAYRSKDPVEWAKAAAKVGGAAGSFLAVHFFAGVVGELFSGRGPAGGDEPEAWDEWTVRKMAGAPLNAYPLAGPLLAAWVEGKAGQLLFDRERAAPVNARAAPILAQIQDGLRHLGTLADSEAGAEEKIWAAVDLTLTASGLGGSIQAKRTGDYLSKLASGEADEIDPLGLGFVSGFVYGEREGQPYNLAKAGSDLLLGKER